MNRTVFHCGLQKTGSTYLQRHVFPCIRGGTYVGTTTFRRTLDVLASGEGPTLISDENLSGRPASGRYREQQRELLSFLSEHWPGARLILFLREPASLLRSFYSQDLLQGGVVAFDEWFDRSNLADALHFDELIDDISGMGWGDAVYFDHTQLRDEASIVVSIMQEFIGCTFEGWTQLRDTGANVGIDRAAGRFLRVANRVVDSPRNPKGRKTRLATRAMRGARIDPRRLVQGGPLRSLNRIGAPLVPEETLASLREHYHLSWARATEKIERSQLPWSARAHRQPSRQGHQGSGWNTAPTVPAPVWVATEGPTV